VVRISSSSLSSALREPVVAQWTARHEFAPLIPTEILCRRAPGWSPGRLYRRIDGQRPVRALPYAVFMHMPCRLRALNRGAIIRVSAAWLIVLTALPFTAPFATVDVADLWGSDHTQSAIAMVSAAGVYSSQPDDTSDDVTMPDGYGQHLLPAARVARTLVTSPTILPATVPAAYVPPVGSTPPPLLDVSTLVVTLRL